MLKISIPKEDISKMDLVKCPVKIYVVDTVSATTSAIAALRKYKVVGFDSETRPSFTKGVSYNVALLQVSTADECFLFRLNKIGMPTKLVEFLEDESVKKIGLSLKDDFGMLSKVSDVHPHGFVDIQHMVPKYGISDISLQKVYAILFGQKISKSQRLTNWEAKELTPAQQAYAAIDAWACLKIYNYLEGGCFDPGTSPYIVNEEPIENSNEKN